MKIQKILIRTLRSISALPIIPIKLRTSLLRLTGINIGKKARVLPKGTFLISEMEIGSESFINRNCFFDDGGVKSKITIGHNTYLAPFVKIICVTHDYSNMNERAGERMSKPITIGDGSWIGANTTVLPGVTIGNGSVVAAGAVVAKDIPDNEMWGGVPARFIKKLD